MYLEPIFASEDIKKDMQSEKSKFDTIDSSWKSTMAKFNVDRNMFDFIDSEKYKSDFIKDHKSLEDIQ